MSENKIKFKTEYTAKQWLSQQKAKVRTALMDQLAGVFDALTEESKSELGLTKPNQLIDLHLKDFNLVMKGFGEAYGDAESIWDSFLG